MSVRVRSGVGERWILPDGVAGLVSVVIPTHNRASMLAETVRSIIYQRYRPIEVQIVDDASTDSTQEVVSRLQSEAPDGVEVAYSRQTRSGAPAARNRGVRNSRGEFLVFMDDDDLFVDGFFSAHVDSFGRNNAANVSCGRFREFKKSGEVYLTSVAKGEMLPDVPLSWEAFLRGWVFAFQSCMLRRSLVSEIGPWREDLRKSQDLDYKARALGNPGCNLSDTPDAVVYYRIHPNSITRNLTREKLDSYVAALDDVEQIATSRPDYELRRPQLADFLWGHHSWLSSQGEYKRAWEVLSRAKLHDPQVSLRNGGSLAGVASSVGLDWMWGPARYLLMRCRNLVSEPRITWPERRTELLIPKPSKVSAESARSGR